MNLKPVTLIFILLLSSPLAAQRDLYDFDDPEEPAATEVSMAKVYHISLGAAIAPGIPMGQLAEVFDMNMLTFGLYLGMDLPVKWQQAMGIPLYRLNLLIHARLRGHYHGYENKAELDRYGEGKMTLITGVSDWIFGYQIRTRSGVFEPYIGAPVGVTLSSVEFTSKLDKSFNVQQSSADMTYGGLAGFAYTPNSSIKLALEANYLFMQQTVQGNFLTASLQVAWLF